MYAGHDAGHILAVVAVAILPVAQGDVERVYGGEAVVGEGDGEALAVVQVGGTGVGGQGGGAGAGVQHHDTDGVIDLPGGIDGADGGGIIRIWRLVDSGVNTLEGMGIVLTIVKKDL